MCHICCLMHWDLWHTDLFRRSWRDISLTCCRSCGVWLGPGWTGRGSGQRWRTSWDSVSVLGKRQTFTVIKIINLHFNYSFVCICINHCRNSQCTQVIMGTLVVVAFCRLERNEWWMGVFGNISVISLSMKERHIGLWWRYHLQNMR